jgi:hypothetical protein
MNPDVLSRKTCRMTLAALATLSCAGLATPAAAQWSPRYNAPGLEAHEEGGEAMVRPQRIMRWVARQGYNEVTQPRLNGSTYVIDGIADDGTRMRFTIDAYDGELISSRPVGRVADIAPETGLRPPGLIPRGGPPEFGEPAPVPPGVIPRRGRPEFGEAAPLSPGMVPRGGPPEYGEAARWRLWRQSGKCGGRCQAGAEGRREAAPRSCGNTSSTAWRQHGACGSDSPGSVGRRRRTGMGDTRGPPKTRDDGERSARTRAGHRGRHPGASEDRGPGRGPHPRAAARDAPRDVAVTSRRLSAAREGARLT